MNDPYEKTNLVDKYPDVVSHLKVFAEKHKEKFYTKKEKE
jgi:hypothetical protein